jgi:putative endonuclease
MTSSLTRPKRGPRRCLDRQRSTGRLGEDLAAAHLERLGLQILARNVRSGSGEIDLIAHGEETIVFVEVKTQRLARGHGAGETPTVPLERLQARQRARLRREASAWLRGSAGSRPRAANLRFDAIGVVLSPSGALVRLDHIESAW